MLNHRCAGYRWLCRFGGVDRKLGARDRPRLEPGRDIKGGEGGTVGPVCGGGVYEGVAITSDPHRIAGLARPDAVQDDSMGITPSPGTPT